MIAKASMKARNSQAEPLVPTASRSKLPARRPSVMIETSIRSEPTSVYTRKRVVAWMRRSPPQMPIRKASGISIASKPT